MERRKPRAKRKEDVLRFRVSAAEKKAITAAAERQGLAVSAWLRLLALREAERLRREVGSGG